jgi:hypothetical protein
VPGLPLFTDNHVRGALIKAFRKLRRKTKRSRRQSRRSTSSTNALALSV